MTYRYILTEACAQCGAEPPYNLLNIPVRNIDGVSQIKIEGEWIDCPKDSARPDVKTYFGLPVAGISTTWEITL